MNEWDGEGPPPVGTVCEVWYDNGRECWRKAEILASARGPENACAAMLMDGDEQYKLIWALNYRPIRTERERVIVGAIKACPYPGSKSTRIDVEALYDAGYLRLPEDDQSDGDPR